MSIIGENFFKIPAFAKFSRLVHNERMNINDWLNALPGSPTVSQAADKAGVSRATFLRHADKGKTTAEYVIAIARAHNVNEIQALADMGFVEEAAVVEMAIDKALGMATNSKLLEEINKRVDPEARRLFYGDGVPDIIDVRDDELAARRADTPVSEPSGSLHDDDDGTVREFDYDIPHAADSSPDENEERIRRGENPID
ncbi:DNA-binding protein [Corynebacterium diphtheriae]|nr:DNA-binding protein [Corynebacterium diphtheriae]CAB0969504.1 DNA-binding protein [Corynebacterium diphtheriae]